MQTTLASLTAIPPGEQILMCDGARLDASKPLSAYSLPSAGGGDKPQDVFLYNRTLLRPGAPLPPAEDLPPVVMDGEAASCLVAGAPCRSGCCCMT